MLNEELKKELAEIEQMVQEAKAHEEYKEKVFFLREGMIKLAGGFVKAALLSSLMGWTEHWLKSDSEVYKQIQEAANENNIEKVRKLKQQIRQGWFWKSYTEMSRELLGEISKSTAERYCKEFEEKGFILSHDPEEKAIYRAKWYKADIDRIKEGLNELGYDLDYYKRQKNSTSQNGTSKNTSLFPIDVPKSQGNSTSQNGKPSHQNGKPSHQNGKHLLYTSFISSSFNSENVVVVEAFKKHMGVTISEEEAILVLNESIKHNKDIEQAIKETIKWADINDEELTNPVGSVIYGIQTGWNLSQQTYKPKSSKSNRKEIAIKSKSSSNRILSDLPKSEQKRMEQEAEQTGQAQADPPELEEKKKRLQEKLKTMTERLNARKKEREAPHI